MSILLIAGVNICHIINYYTSLTSSCVCISISLTSSDCLRVFLSALDLSEMTRSAVKDTGEEFYGSLVGQTDV